MTEHTSSKEPEEPLSPAGAEATEGLPNQDSVTSDDELLAAAQEPYTPPSDEPQSDQATPPPHEPPPGQAHQNQAPPQQGQLPPYPGQPQRLLFRSRNDRKIGGVAGGIARYLGVDPTVVRIVFLVLALTGTSILLYLAAWILMPEHPAGQPEPVWRERATDRNLAIAVGLASLGLAVAILNESWLVLAIILIAGGVWLLSEKPLVQPAAWSPMQPGPGDATPYATTPAEPAYAAAGFGASATNQAGNAATNGGWGWYTPPAPGPGDAIDLTPAPRRGPQRITRGVLSLLAILIAVAIAAAAGDWWDISGARMLGIAIVIIGVGVIAGAATNAGARGLIPLGVLAVILLIPAMAVDGLVDAGIGTSTYQPLTLDSLESDYSLGVGELTVDLSRLDLDGVTRNVDIDIGMGELTLILPDDVGGSLDLDSTAGELIVNLPGSANDLSVEGINHLTDTVVLPGDRGELVLDIEIGLGVVDVRGN